MNPDPTPEFLLCLCTVPDAATGERLARLWIGEGWAACVNRLPGVQSLFLWQGKVDSTCEELLWVKTTPAGAARIRDSLTQHHPYDCPEWIEIPFTAAAGYGAWIRESVNKT